MSLIPPRPADDRADPASFADGRYVVERVLGQGSQKCVYLVRDTALERLCALALLRGEGIDDEARGRVASEARAMGRLGSHPNLITVFDTGEHDNGLPYFVTEYAEHGDLRERLASALEHPLPLEESLQIVADIAAALVAIHAIGIVHRDIKPANIWFGEDGTAKLGDFGLAIIGRRSRITQAGNVLGTATYMAPEQAVGSAVDARSDLYALGVLFYELLTGRPPFLGHDSLAVLSQHVHAAPIAPSWHNSAVSAELDVLVLRLLSKVADDRPDSAADVLECIRQMMDRRVTAPEGAPADTHLPRHDLQALAWGRFVGRQSELEQLKRALDATFSGRGMVVLISGEPGIGKTSLAREISVYARMRGAHVMSGRCDEQDGAIPYRPFVEAFRQYVRERPDSDVRAELGKGAQELATLISEIRERLTDVPQRAASEGEAERLRLFDSITAFLRNCSGTAPLVLCLDDLHWADKSSLLLLCHLAREVHSDRILILGAYRDVELDRQHPLSEMIPTLRREQTYQRLLLRGLPEGDVGELLAVIEPAEAAADGRQALASILFQETEGNPFFIREILTHLVEEGKLYRRDGHWTSDASSATQLGIPEGVREVIGRRISRLSAACQQLLTIASAMAGELSWPVLLAVSGGEEGSALDLLDEALAAQLVGEARPGQPGSLEFTHALIRQTLYEAMSTPRRVLLHERIGAALEGLYGADLEPFLPQLANHYYRAAHGGRSINKAIDYAQRAAKRAARQHAYDEAVRHYERAIELLELIDIHAPLLEVELMLDLTEQFWNCGEYSKARDQSTRAARLAASANAGELMARAAIAYSSNEAIGFNLGVFDAEELELLERALAFPDQTDAHRALLMSRIAERLQATDQHERRRSLAREAVRLGRTVGDPEVLRRVIAGAIVSFREPALLDDRLALVAEIRELTVRERDPRWKSFSELLLAVESLEAGDLDQTRPAFQRLDALSKQSRRPYEQWTVACWNVDQALFEGRFDDAEREAQRALAVGLSEQNQNAAGVFGAQLFFLRREQGRLAEMLPALETLIRQYPLVRAWRCGLASLHVELHDFDAARAELAGLAEHGFKDFPPDFLWLLSMCVLAEAAYRLGDAHRSEQLFAMLSPYTTRNVNATTIGPCLGSGAYYAALAAAGAGILDDADRLFSTGIAENERMRMPVWAARARGDYSEMLVRRAAPGDTEKASTLRHDALQAARRLEMVAFASRMEAIIGASGKSRD